MMTVMSMTMTAMTAMIIMVEISSDASYLSHTARMLVCLLPSQWVGDRDDDDNNDDDDDDNGVNVSYLSSQSRMLISLLSRDELGIHDNDDENNDNNNNDDNDDDYDNYLSSQRRMLISLLASLSSTSGLLIVTAEHIGSGSITMVRNIFYIWFGGFQGHFVWEGDDEKPRRYL